MNILLNLLMRLLNIVLQFVVQRLQSVCPVADRILYLLTELTEGLVISFRHEERIISESSVSPLFQNQVTFNRSPCNDRLPVRIPL